MIPKIGRHYHHGPSGAVGAVVHVYAPGEHPTASCEVVRLSTGDELAWRPDDFTELGVKGLGAFVGIVGAPGSGPSVGVMHLAAAARVALQHGVSEQLVRAMLLAAGKHATHLALHGTLPSGPREEPPEMAKRLFDAAAAERDREAVREQADAEAVEQYRDIFDPSTGLFAPVLVNWDKEVGGTLVEPTSHVETVGPMEPE